MDKKMTTQSGPPSGDIRDAFIAWLDEGADATEVEIDGNKQSITRLFDQIRDCADILPRVYCDDLEIPQGSTYADAVKKLESDQDTTA